MSDEIKELFAIIGKNEKDEDYLVGVMTSVGHMPAVSMKEKGIDILWDGLTDDHKKLIKAKKVRFIEAK